eukprot:TRINITY_DN8033_c0_g1_i1.p4 TRINITY_DN8033_c0_g1~~TRINITY_DN8033_c0_g1_i1.p4  ORF type:complete len:103 (-),score=39.05 TRINITY_DN8033_c0_g1_i1:410-718(-)
MDGGQAAITAAQKAIEEVEEYENTYGSGYYPNDTLTDLLDHMEYMQYLRDTGLEPAKTSAEVILDDLKQRVYRGVGHDCGGRDCDICARIVEVTQKDDLNLG